MIITIEHFTCTPLAKQNLLPAELNLTSEEKEVLDLIAFYEDSNLEYKSEIENIFDELSGNVNLTRLVALNLLKYHVDKPTSQSTQPLPLLDDLELFNIPSHHPVDSNTTNNSAQITSSPASLEMAAPGSTMNFADESNDLDTQKSKSTIDNPMLHVVMGLFDKDN
ncbi:hypothetical protein [Psychrobacter sp. I-STPA10]|uniref:hypothetical protein n=1 Tax=Psychrobacter sp. I-STPA10 TaxID=2585769 RepID=UPI001E621F14|nr:hypothetical protein [Psychrobacter sp. I-STPA10]